MNTSTLFFYPAISLLIIVIEFGIKCPAEESSSQFRTLLLRKYLPSTAERENRSRGSAASSFRPKYSLDRNCPDCQCGFRHPSRSSKRRPKILAGTDSKYGEHPWQVSIERKKRWSNDWRQHCGGALISNSFVLTAAHCFLDSGSDYRVVVGNYDLGKKDDSEQIFHINEGDYINNRDFASRSEFDNDISIVRLCNNGRGVEFDEHVQAICLPEKDIQLPSGTTCYVSGWGTKDKSKHNKATPVLQSAAVPLQSHRQCAEAYNADDLRENYLRRIYFPNERLRQKSVVHEGNLCAGGGKQDVCSGDSGGPLTCRHPDNPNMFFLMGIVSWGKECGSKTHPTIYTKVSHYLQWINTEMKLSQCSQDRYHYYQK